MAIVFNSDLKLDKVGSSNIYCNWRLLQNKTNRTRLVLLAGAASLLVEAKIDHRPAKIRLVLVKVLLMSYLSF